MHSVGPPPPFPIHTRRSSFCICRGCINLLPGVALSSSSTANRHLHPREAPAPVISSAFFPDDNKPHPLLNQTPWALPGWGTSPPLSPISSPAPRLPWARRHQRPGLHSLPPEDPGAGLTAQPHPWPARLQRSQLCSVKLPPRTPGEPQRKHKALGYLGFFLPGNSASLPWKGVNHFHPSRGRAPSLVFGALETKLLCVTITPLGLKPPHCLLPPSAGEVPVLAWVDLKGSGLQAWISLHGAALTAQQVMT